VLAGVREAIARGAIGFDAVKHLVLRRISATFARGRRPLARRHHPLFLEAVQHQEDEFCSGVVTWEMTPGSDRPAEFGIQSLNSIRGV
jgi:hypothetical protein